MKSFFKWSQISAFRLTRHHLVDQNPADLTTVSQNVCGMQAQVMAAAQKLHGKLNLGSRGCQVVLRGMMA